MRLDNGNNQFIGTDANEIIAGLNGRDIIFGGDGADRIDGGEDADDIFGGDKRDQLNGGANSDVIEGGSGDDLIYGDGGDDILRGQGGNDALIGGPGNDTLTGLGFGGNIFGGGEGQSPLNTTRNRADILRGDDRSSFGFQDTFDLQRTTDDEGRLFVKGQQYAIIRDFEPDRDKIRLPGNAGDYVARLVGTDNQDTAIFYTENTDIDIGIGIGALSLGTSLAVDVDDGNALVAIVENNIVRNMYNSVFYEYKGVG